jgi:integrase
MRAMTKERGTRQKQAAPLLWEHIERILQVEPETLRDYRDRAMLVVAYDTMCRREELVALNLGHISHQRDGSATVLIARAKNDRDGKGHQSYLAHLSVDILDDWIQRAGIKDGALFRVIGGKYDGKRLKPAAVATVFRRCVKWIASSEKELEGISGHSTRVGATQDQLAANIDTNSVKQSGRWADERMVGRYGEHILAARSGMARLAKLQGRTKAATPARKRTSESHAAVAFARSRRA